MRRLGRGLGRVIRGFVVLWLLTYAAVLGWTYLWPLDRPVPQGDVIVCLSGGGDVPGVTPEGVASRAEACEALFDAGAAPRVLFTGGGLDDRLPSSAATMAEATGIPASATLIEPNAQSTLQNAVFTLALVAPEARLILVTEAYHLPRAWASYRMMGGQDIALAASTRVVRTDRGEFFNRHPLLRESLAIWFNLARYAGYRIAGLVGVAQERRIGWLH